ncbi:TRAP transporter substrate-binding protein [Microbaculum marinum]|uniref:TRAP transporter substrate-binding protein n=1 Tax=Microbaculum marinum TaxID=1764581 RepID=A0AAW9RJH9_9HYPH
MNLFAKTPLKPAVFGLVAGTLGVLATLAPASAEEIKIAVGCPPVPICSDWVWAEDFAAKLKEEGLEAKVFTGGALGKDPEVVDQLAQGLIQVGLTNFVMIKQVDPAVLGFLAPYMFDDMAHMFRALDETDIVDSIDANMQQQGIKIGGLIGLGGTIGIFNTKHPVTSVADLSDLRLRAIDSSQMALFDEWGVPGVVVDMPEVATSLQKGMIDGYVNPPVVAFIFKHTDFLKYYTDVGAGTPIRSVLMSLDWYDGLGADEKQKVDAALAYANDRNRDWTYKAAEQEIAKLKELGVEVSELSPEARAEFRETSQKAWAELMPPEAVEAFKAAAGRTRQ